MKLSFPPTRWMFYSVIVWILFTICIFPLSYPRYFGAMACGIFLLMLGVSLGIFDTENK
jgi:hypothetical protein